MINGDIAEGLGSNSDGAAAKRRALWEEGFFQQIIRYLDNPDQPFSCRLHFLCTDKQKVYVLDKEDWWHTLPGSTSNIRERLLHESNFNIGLVRVHKSSRGWIAYFARKRSEEFGMGWNDKGLNIRADDRNLLRRARRAHKAYLEWVLVERTKWR
jgi:hypothetical protein